MTKNSGFQAVIFAVIFILPLIFSSCSSNWPQFRGPENNMVASGNLPLEWANDTNVAWTYDVTGSGWSSPVVWGNKVFITTSYPEKSATAIVQELPPPPPPPPPPAERRDTSGTGQGASLQPPRRPPPDTSYLMDTYVWEISCLDLSTGELLWNQVAHKGNPRIKKHARTNYASETPVTDGKRIYAYFGMCGMFCYDMEGTLLWKKDLGAYETLNGWGTGSSPVIYKDILYIQVDNEVNSFIVALNAETGEQIWKAEREEKTNYSTAVIWKNSIRTELVASGKKARSYDLQTGEILWELNLGGEMNIPSPVTNKDHLYLGNAGGRDTTGTLFSVIAGAHGDITPPQGETTSEGVEWSLPDAGTANPSPLLHEGLIYILAGRGGEISCYDASTGKEVYKEKVAKVSACWASPWAHKDKIYFIDDKGVTHILKAGAEFEVLGCNSLDDTFWASVGITRNAYIFKGVERIYCIK